VLDLLPPGKQRVDVQHNLCRRFARRGPHHLNAERPRSPAWRYRQLDYRHDPPQSIHISVQLPRSERILPPFISGMKPGSHKTTHVLPR